MERKWTYLGLAIGMMFFGLLDFSGALAFGQATTGAIVGAITDSLDAVIPDAEVTITNTATTQSRILQTDGAGRYDAEALPVGTYQIAVRKDGFKAQIVQGIILDASARVAANATLQVGSSHTEVTIIASAEKVETETGESSGVVSGEKIQQLLLNGRNFFGLAVLIPGVVNTTGMQAQPIGGQTPGSNLSINGGDSQLNNTTIDGTWNMNTGAYGNINVVTPLDAISEFRVLKDNYSAKYGFNGSAQIQVVTKSGTQTFHGAVYDYLRNDALDASNFFTGIDPATGKKRVTRLKQNNFGFAIGGPIYIPGKYNTDRKKTFFFVNEEWRRRNAGLTLRGAMIPQPMRNGDFTNSPTLRAGGLKFDAVATGILAQHFPGANCLPAPNTLNPACFDPNAVAIMNRFWPLLNNPSGGFLNYINPGVDRIANRDDSYRVDHYFNEKNRLMARFSYETTQDAPPAATNSSNPAPTTTQTIGQTGFNSVLRWTANISPTLINEVTWAAGHDKPRLAIQGLTLTPDIKINYPFPNAVTVPDRNQYPNISIGGGWAGISNAGGYPFHASDGAQTVADDLTMVKGSHVLQAGGMYMWGIKRQDTFAATSGNFSFSGVHTNDPVSDFLLGLDSSFNQGDHVPRHYSRWKQYEAYVQDDWKATRRLTLNLGLRYVYGVPENIQGDIFSDFDPKTFNPANAPVVLPNGGLLVDANKIPLTASGTRADLLNGIVFPGTTRLGKPAVQRTIYNSWKGGFAPRVGFAWDVTGDGKTAVRGGYGMGYTFFRYGTEGSVINTPWVQSVSLLNGTLTDPSLGTPGAKTTTSLSIAGPPGAIRKPLIFQDWSLTIEREVVPSGVLNVAYVGSRGTQLEGSRDINFPLPVNAPSIANPNCLQPGQTIPPGGFNFDPCLNAGLVSSSFTRPLAGWSNITSFRGASDYFGKSFYNSLQAGFKYRPPTRGLTLSAAYTWSKAFQDTGAVTGSAQNPRNFRAEYGLAAQDRPHVFTASYIYQLPIFRDRSDFVGTAFGNWTFSGLTGLFSGAPLTPGLATGRGGLANRPNCVAPVAGPKTLGQWFNTDAFAAPAFGFFGNCGTGIIRGPGEQTWNWALFKTFPIGERLKVQFRSEFFNIWNHPNWNGISTGFQGTNSAGKIIGNFGRVVSAKEPRQIEFALRLDF